MLIKYESFQLTICMNWIGKAAVIKYLKEAPFRLL